MYTKKKNKSLLSRKLRAKLPIEGFIQPLYGITNDSLYISSIKLTFSPFKSNVLIPNYNIISSKLIS